jgi:DNA-binding SARP family transcriptional activator
LRLDPLNSRLALRLIMALAAAGDPAGALEVAQSHETLLREELDVGPDKTLVEFCRRLRSQFHEP